MNASHRHTARPARHAWRALARAAASTALVLLLAGCGSSTTSPGASGPTGTAAAPPVATPAPAATPVAYADTLRVGWFAGHGTGFRALDLAGWYPSISFAPLVYSSLYRYDARYSAIPDLADGPCFVPGADARVIRCRLVETTFHDGTPLTADDVAYTYRLFALPDWCGIWVPCTLAEVRVVDPRTVDFVLSSVDPTFLTTGVTGVPIFSRREVEAKYAAFAAAAEGLTADGVQELVDTIGEETGGDPHICSDARLAEVDALLAQLGGLLYREDFRTANGTFDECGYLEGAASALQYVAWALQSTGPGAVIQSLVFWSAFQPPAGTGPYRLVSEDAGRVHLEAFTGYHGGVAATKYVDFVPAADDGSDLEDGAIDIAQSSSFGAAFEAAAGERALVVAKSLTPGYFALAMNVRPGRLFADVALRRALQLCIDLKRDVDAATVGGTPIYGPVLPGSWADDPDLPKPRRDIAAAKALIEGAGWRLGPDGVYEKDGRRLAATVPVRDTAADRIRMVDLIGKEARDCGMDLEALPLAFGVITDELLQFPHNLPGTATPFELYLAGLLFAPEPADALNGFTSAQITDSTHPDGAYSYFNYIGFSDPEFDRLVAKAGETYDPAERARLYRAAQEVLASKVPMIFLYGVDQADVLRTAVTTADGPLDLTTPNWGWQPERLVVAASP